MVNETKKARSE